jgi:hypothetical protein
MLVGVAVGVAIDVAVGAEAVGASVAVSVGISVAVGTSTTTSGVSVALQAVKLEIMAITKNIRNRCIVVSFLHKRGCIIASKEISRKVNNGA